MNDLKPAIDEDEIIETLTCYAMGLGKVQEATGWPIQKIEEFALNNNVEKCAECEWFVHSWQLVDDTGVVHEECDDCREYDQDE